MTDARCPSPRDVVIRPLRASDLATSEQVMRVAFGTLLGLPEPSAFMGDASFAVARWVTTPQAAFAAEVDGELVGSIFATRWGSFASFGPLTVRPDCWDQGIASLLLEPVMDLFARWEVGLAGLFTNPSSPKHLGLYHKFGFSPRFLTPVMAKAVASVAAEASWSRYSELTDVQRLQGERDCRTVTEAIYAGLDLTPEIQVIQARGLGDTLLLWDAMELVGFAVCHCGPGTEAGGGNCYVKFAAIRPGPEAGRHFGQLLRACESFAAGQGLLRLVAGVNTARQEAYEQMRRYGFRAEVLGVAMHRPNEAGFSRPGVYVIDDWR